MSPLRRQRRRLKWWAERSEGEGKDLEKQNINESTAAAVELISSLYYEPFPGLFIQCPYCTVRCFAYSLLLLLLLLYSSIVYNIYVYNIIWYPVNVTLSLSVCAILMLYNVIIKLDNIIIYLLSEPVLSSICSKTFSAKHLHKQQWIIGAFKEISKLTCIFST